MPLTSQIIKKIVQDEISSAVFTLEHRLTALETKFDLRFDQVIEQLADIAGKFRKFDEEQTILSAQMSDRTDRIEKLELAVFGAAPA